MKKFTSFLMLALVSVFGATTANAQDLIPWDENGQFRLYPEDLICEGGVEWDDDAYAFHFTGTEAGRIYLRAVGEGAKTIDFSEVASIETFGPAGKEDPWGSADPCATLYVHDAVNGRINEWFGSRYNISYNDYAKNSTKIDSIYFTSRAITDESGAVTGYVEGYVSIDEIVLTKSVEQDPQAILAKFWHEWDGYDENAQPLTEDQLAYCDVKLNTLLSGGTPFAGVMNGTVPGNVYADLTQYAGIYIKGVPGTPWRGLFNRQSMEDAGDYLEVVLTLNDEGEATIIFAEDDRTKDCKYIHLNTAKINWGAPEGAKITKFNYIEKDPSAINNAVKDNDVKATNEIYNLAGQKVSESYKGIVIKNGQKILNK